MVNECIVIDEANVANNTWVGGQFEWSSGGAAINATAGNNNRVVGANFASAGEIAINSIGVVIYGSRGATGTETLGGLNVSPLAGDGAVSIDSVMAHAAEVLFKQAGVARWGIVRDTSANLLFNRYNAAGALLGTAAWFEPTAGVFNIGALSAAGVGFFGSGVSTTRPIVTGSRGGNTALASMLSAMATLGLITDNTTP
jgi:hypothetical protein